MTQTYLDLASTQGVRAVRAAKGADALWDRPRDPRPSDHFTASEIAFIAARDSVYMATVSETGWPYVQHRGGAPGFLRVLDGRTLAFADYRGNRQYISLGNLATDNRVALILMDYPGRQRLKIYAEAEVKTLADDPALTASLTTARGRPDGIIVLHLRAFDWNCPQHITPRFTESEIAAAVKPIRDRLLALEAENADLRRGLDQGRAVAEPARAAPGG